MPDILRIRLIHKNKDMVKLQESSSSLSKDLQRSKEYTLSKTEDELKEIRIKFKKASVESDQSTSRIPNEPNKSVTFDVRTEEPPSVHVSSATAADGEKELHSKVNS
eukprot:CAMPEP_0170511716 /NCGR_PEP_ID=MMETSP0208-20121228/66457_1 /TAXON_ID=197538 /ORGANISM="Strombidium inclinatum, Strain S3" /LENGTH=106 /DNA_ID=CAMNT_0010795279 /DNA_START=85 /DNA_END=405 /DNA_ORIENTATION=-